MAEEVAEFVRQGRIEGAYPSGFGGYASILCNRRDEVWLDGFSLEDSPLGYSRTWVVLTDDSDVAQLGEEFFVTGADATIHKSSRKAQVTT